MKVIAWYLPQFHIIPENNEWWGEGFTEWTNVKKAEPLSEEHNQPRVPLNNYYYDLSKIETMQWQVNLAKKYGIYGFCIYHYWFHGKLLLQKPLEQYLDHKELELPYCICWANEHWTSQWVSGSEKILIEQKYGREKQWKEHFDYLYPFFKDERYIKYDEKPLFVIYRPDLIDCLNEMLDYWQKLAEEKGLRGIAFAYQGYKWDYVKKKDDSRFCFDIEYQPTLSWNAKRQKNILVKIQDSLPKFIKRSLAGSLNILRGWLIMKETAGKIYDYDKEWEDILNHIPASDKSVPGVFVDWDNTPRRGIKGTYMQGASPEKFKEYFKRMLIKAKKEYQSDMIFVFSWNEWAEGGYLEPDEKNKYGYLEAVYNALKETDELEYYYTES